MNKLKARVIPVLVFALSALATLALADYPYPPQIWPCANCEPYSHSDSTKGGCEQCCEEDCPHPQDDGTSLLHCYHCCSVRNGGDPNKEPHCVAGTNPAPEESDSSTL